MLAVTVWVLWPGLAEDWPLRPSTRVYFEG
jgi:hypothetical protein